MVLEINKKLRWLSRAGAWLMLPLILAYIATGFSMTGLFGFDKLLNVFLATRIHTNLWIPFVIFFVLHAGLQIYFALCRKKPVA